jgi:hypothetical protein
MVYVLNIYRKHVESPLHVLPQLVEGEKHEAFEECMTGNGLKQFSPHLLKGSIIGSMMRWKDEDTFD